MSCAINKGGFFEIAFVVVIVVVDTHLPRFEALAYVLPHFDALTHVVIRVSSAFIFQTFAEVCYSVFVNRSSFKSVLNLRMIFVKRIYLSISVYLPRFEALAYVLPHFDVLTHVLIRMSPTFIFQTFAEVCYSVFVKRSSFKSLLNLRKAYIFQEFAEGLLSICVG